MKQPKRLLLIGGTNLLQASNHRVKHLAAQLKSWGYPVDIVGQVNFYTGPQTNRWKRFLRGSRSILYARGCAVRDGQHSQITIRSLPGVLPNLVRELWALLILKPFLKDHYALCLFGHPRNALLALLLKRIGIVESLIYDDWDYYPGHVTTSKRLLDGPLLRIREALCIQNADVVISVSEPLAKLRIGQGARQVLVIPNGVDFSLFSTAQRKRPHPPTLLFMGNLFAAWGADLPLRSLPAIREKIPDIRYVIVGSGPAISSLRRLAYEELRLNGAVSFRGRQPYSELPGLLAEADVGVLTYRLEAFTQYASSLKAREYMAAGLPVIGTRVGEIADVIEKSHAGVIVDFAPDAFAEAVIKLFLDPRDYECYSANAIVCAMQYDWSQLFGPLRGLVDRYAARGV
ncbi:MAG: glycosyltransferase family 4 protein [Chloroflexi bacterium]|nr:glycosyltransferase family 4 protein [Chloroflexota bacterium]